MISFANFVNHLVFHLLVKKIALKIGPIIEFGWLYKEEYFWTRYLMKIISNKQTKIRFSPVFLIAQMFLLLFLKRDRSLKCGTHLCHLHTSLKFVSCWLISVWSNLFPSQKLIERRGVQLSKQACKVFMRKDSCMTWGGGVDLRNHKTYVLDFPWYWIGHFNQNSTPFLSQENSCWRQYFCSMGLRQQVCSLLFLFALSASAVCNLSAWFHGISGSCIELNCTIFKVTNLIRWIVVNLFSLGCNVFSIYCEAVIVTYSYYGLFDRELVLNLERTYGRKSSFLSPNCKEIWA